MVPRRTRGAELEPAPSRGRDAATGVVERRGARTLQSGFMHVHTFIIQIYAYGLSINTNIFIHNYINMTGENMEIDPYKLFVLNFIALRSSLVALLLNYIFTCPTKWE